MKKTVTGIYGGSFNPIHNGHVSLARAFLATGMLDEVWLMVSPQNPLKSHGGLLDDNMRLRMAQLALANVPGVTASGYEFGLPRPSYTWNTLQALERDYAGREFVLLIGADNWAHFGRWYRSADILQRYRIFVYPRPEYAIDAASLPRGVTLLDTPLIDISSTQVRGRIKAGGDISALVPPVVEAMIHRENLYL